MVVIVNSIRLKCCESILANTLFLQIFSPMAFIEQKENDNNDNLCKCTNYVILLYYHFPMEDSSEYIDTSCSPASCAILDVATPCTEDVTSVVSRLSTVASHCTMPHVK